MKNGMLIWNVLLTLLVGWLLIGQFRSKKTTKSTTGIESKDTLSDSSNIRIAYFEMDSVAANFVEVKQLKNELLKREEDNNNELNKLVKDFRDKYDYYQKRVQDGQLTEAQSLAATEEMKQLDDNIKNRRAQLEQDYSDFMVRRQNDIKAKIETFIKEYNKSQKYTYVVSDDPGLFYYQDTTFNITNDVINGLNKMYPPKKVNK
jgi:outer membrane protein